MAKVVYSACYGGFGLSTAAEKMLSARKKKKVGMYADGIARHDPDLAEIVEALGQDANGQFANLCIREVPDGARYRIDEYDGFEEVILFEEQEWITADTAKVKR